MGEMFGTSNDPVFLLEAPRKSSRSLMLLDGLAQGPPELGDISGNQFRILNLGKDEDGKPVFQDPHESQATLTGGEDRPDVRARVELVAFNAGPEADEAIDTATLRLDVGQDELSRSSLQPLFWSIAAGLDLSELVAGKKDAPKNFRSDFQRSFGQRPIEIGGGLGRLRFEVVAHKPKPWWRQVFSFASSGAGKGLVNVLGFPGIMNEAIALIDSAFDRIGDGSQKILFRSAPMTFALSEHARSEFTLGMPGVQVGVLNTGFSLLLPHRYFDDVIAQRPSFLGSYGRLLPQGKSLADFAEPGYEDPFAQIPYAVLRIRLEEASLTSSL